MRIEKTTITILSIISILSISTIMLISVHAQENKEPEIIAKEPSLLAIQYGQSGSISPINSTNYSMQLNDLADKVTLFSDRPYRLVTTQSIQDFVDNWTKGSDSFLLDPPNAALVLLTPNNDQDIFEIELFNPVYDNDKKTIKYEFTILGNSTSSGIPKDMGKSALIIDDLYPEMKLEVKAAVNDQITD
jgi:hypothetical protein